MKGKIVCIQTLARNVMESYWLRRLKWFIPRKVGVKWRNFVSAISILNEVIKKCREERENDTAYYGLLIILDYLGLRDKEHVDRLVRNAYLEMENVRNEAEKLRKENEELKEELLRRERKIKELKEEITKLKEDRDYYEKEYYELYREYREYKREVEPVKNVPLLCIACMMRYWDPKVGCRREYYTGVECDLKLYCERLSKLIDWDWGKRPKGETIKKFLERFMCRFCQYRYVRGEVK